MLCPRIETCGFFKKYKCVIGEQRYEQLMATYCQGPLQPLCKRLQYLAEHGEDPSPDLRPDGYRAGTDKKIYR